MANSSFKASSFLPPLYLIQSILFPRGPSRRVKSSSFFYHLTWLWFTVCNYVAKGDILSGPVLWYTGELGAPDPTGGADRLSGSGWRNGGLSQVRERQKSVQFQFTSNVCYYRICSKNAPSDCCDTKELNAGIKDDWAAHKASTWNVHWMGGCAGKSFVSVQSWLMLQKYCHVYRIWMY